MDNYQKILDAACELGVEKRWDQVTIKQIAEKAGVSRPYIHLCFPSIEKRSSKEGIFRKIVNDFFAGLWHLLSHVLKILPSHVSPLERLHIVLRGMLDYFEEHSKAGNLVLNTQVLRLLPEGRKRGTFYEFDSLLEVCRNIDRLILDIKEQGGIGAIWQDIPPVEIRNLFLDMVNEMANSCYLDSGKPPDDPPMTKKEAETLILVSHLPFFDGEAKDQLENIIHALLRQLASEKA